MNNEVQQEITPEIKQKLGSLIASYISIETDIKDLREQQKDILAEVKLEGLDGKPVSYTHLRAPRD